MNWTMFEPINREVRTIPSALSTRLLTKLSWKVGIKAGATVAPGTKLATAYWDDGTSETLAAPAGCSGTIAWVNRQIDYGALSSPPSDVLLRLQ